MPLLVADVGGTFARVAWAGEDGSGPVLHGLQRYRCADHPSLAAILSAFSLSTPPPRGSRSLARAVVAIAGVMQGDALVNANLAWPVSLRETREQAGLHGLELINDFEAIALAVPFLRSDQRSLVHAGGSGSPQWPALVLGPGTGLGAALCFADGSRRVLSSEAGHAALAAGNSIELAVVAQLLQRWPHVGNERVLSGTGLLNLYQTLAGVEAQTVRWHSTEALLAAAKGGEDALAVRTVEVFCAWLGSLVGDLALTFGARSVFLAGGITDHVADFLAAPAFGARMVDKGVLGAMLRQVPVWRVEDAAIGVMGAAAWTPD